MTLNPTINANAGFVQPTQQVGNGGVAVLSTVANLFGSVSGGSSSGPSSIDRKHQVLTQVTSGLSKIEANTPDRSSQDKLGLTRNFLTKAIQAAPEYADDIRQLATDMSGVETISPKNAAEITLDNIESWATGTSEGQAAQAAALAVGGGDPEIYQAEITKRFQQSQASQAQLAVLQRAVELGNLKAEVALEQELLPSWSRRSADIANTMAGLAVRVDGAFGEDALAQIDSQVAVLKSQYIQEANALGLTGSAKNDAIESALVPLQSMRDFVGGESTRIQEVIKTLQANGQKKTLDFLVSEFGAMGADPNYGRAVLEYMATNARNSKLSDEGFLKRLTEFMKGTVNLSSATTVTVEGERAVEAEVANLPKEDQKALAENFLGIIGDPNIKAGQRSAGFDALRMAGTTTVQGIVDVYSNPDTLKNSFGEGVEGMAAKQAHDAWATDQILKHQRILEEAGVRVKLTPRGWEAQTNNTGKRSRAGASHPIDPTRTLSGEPKRSLQALNALTNGMALVTDVPLAQAAAEMNKVNLVVEQDDEFNFAMHDTAGRLGINPLDLAAVINFESGFSPTIENYAGSGATGLIQFMPSTMRGLNVTKAELLSMSRAQQMEVVEQYLTPLLSGVPNPTLEDVYMAVLWPIAVGKPSTTPILNQNSKQYEQNKGLDLNGDGMITKAEATVAVRRKAERDGIYEGQTVNPRVPNPVPEGERLRPDMFSAVQDEAPIEFEDRREVGRIIQESENVKTEAKAKEASEDRIVEELKRIREEGGALPAEFDERAAATIIKDLIERLEREDQ